MISKPVKQLGLIFHFQMQGRLFPVILAKPVGFLSVLAAFHPIPFAELFEQSERNF